MERAERLLPTLTAHLGEVIGLVRPEIEEAVFYGKIISKLSPFVGNILESRIVTALNAQVTAGFRWIRQDPDFPDAALVGPDGRRTDSGFEVKAWYVLSTEITGRFRESQNLLEGKDIRVCIVPWMLSNVIYGHPVVLDVCTVDALSVAKARDAHYHKPPDYLIAEPRNTTSRTRNLQQTNVAGYRLQPESARSDSGRLSKFVAENPGVTKNPHSSATQKLVNSMMGAFDYRLDTNFAKIDRIQHAEIENLKSRMLGIEYRGLRVRDWAGLLKDLESGTEVEQATAQRTLLNLFESL